MRMPICVAAMVAVHLSGVVEAQTTVKSESAAVYVKADSGSRVVRRLKKG